MQYVDLDLLEWVAPRLQMPVLKELKRIRELVRTCALSAPYVEIARSLPIIEASSNQASQSATVGVGSGKGSG
jgi:hypothetical protein